MSWEGFHVYYKAMTLSQILCQAFPCSRHNSVLLHKYLPRVPTMILSSNHLSYSTPHFTLSPYRPYTILVSLLSRKTSEISLAYTILANPVAFLLALSTMPSTIPYDPRLILILANVIKKQALDLVGRFATAQTPVDAAQEHPDAMIASKRRLDSTMSSST